MGERALTAASLEETEDVARGHRKDEPSQGESPAIALLDAMRRGDDLAVLAVCGETTVVSADNMNWSCRGRDEINEMLVEIRGRFPGITFESRTRHVGFGLVIDEARVQEVRLDDDDLAALAGGSDESPADEVVAKHLAEPEPDVHPMWDEPVAEERNALAVWRDASHDALPPARLNMPVRVTVRHDDLQVHEVSLSFPAALLKRSLGMYVDPLEMSLSEVQSAFIAPVGAGFTSYELARPELAVVPPPTQPGQEVLQTEPPRRRRRLLVPVLVALIAVIAAGGWWVVQGQGGTDTANAPTPSPSIQPSAQPSASLSPSAQPSSTAAPKVTQAKPSNAPSRKPNITLTSDLAFSKNSARLSSKAEREIAKIARQVRAAGLSGTIYVNGYTDNLGSAASGRQLSRARANAVSAYLGSQLVGVPVTITSIANGESDPIRSNATAAGRQANRRVTITLPKP